MMLSQNFREKVMSGHSKIEWTEATWNPITGCTPISHGCDHCYAKTLAKRLKAMGNPNYSNGFELTLHHKMLKKPLSWKKSKLIFVNSMSDMFHDNVPFEFIEEIFFIMTEAHWHTFQILTKRAENLEKYALKIKWPKNVWMGVTVESEKYINRIDKLRKTPAYIKFLSFEPLLSNMPVLNLNNINWVIVGGESGARSRPMLKEWVVNIKQQCDNNNIPFFFKQWGGFQKNKNGRLLNGKKYMAMPKF